VAGCGEDRAYPPDGCGALDRRPRNGPAGAPDPGCVGAYPGIGRRCFELAAGGTAVGTGLNAPPNFSRDIAATIATLTGHPFITAPNKFAAQGSLDAMVAAMAPARTGRGTHEVANDMRWLASGPRCGLTSSCCPRTSRALRSCLERSTRRSRKPWSWSASR